MSGYKAVCKCGGEVLFDALITFTSNVMDSFDTNVCNSCWQEDVQYELEPIDTPNKHDQPYRLEKRYGTTQPGTGEQVQNTVSKE